MKDIICNNCGQEYNFQGDINYSFSCGKCGEQLVISERDKMDKQITKLEKMLNGLNKRLCKLSSVV